MSVVYLLSKSPPFGTRISMVVPIRHTIFTNKTFVFFQVSEVSQQLVKTWDKHNLIGTTGMISILQNEVSHLLTTSECKKNKRIDGKEFDDVDDHSTKRYLKWSQMWIHREQVDKF